MYSTGTISVVLIACSAFNACLSTSFANPVLVLDDAEAARSSLKPSTLESCLKDCHANAFHQGSTVEGLAVYTFDPEEDGCYVMEEWHPGNDKNCAEHMSREVRLDVNYCKGKTAYTFIDQSLNGGRWNVLGALPFYKGWQGKLSLKNEGITNCQLGTSCLFAADAFRLRKVPMTDKGCRAPKEVYEEVQEPTTIMMTTTTTTTADMPLMLQAQAVVETFAQTIVDDIDAVSHAAWHWHEKSAKSSLLSCGSQGWKQRFLFLDPTLTEETDAPAIFTFNPPEHGCYLVEEFHPGNVCDKVLSPLVQLRIEYRNGKKMSATLDQTKFGNRWNSVALLPFDKGRPGKVTVHHPQVNEGVAVADAFRFTRVSGTCASAPLKLVEYARLSQHPVSVTIDDRHAFTQGAHVASVCGKTALDASVHAAVEGAASAVFTFVPPSTGCFRVDEFHPKADDKCTLAATAGVQVDYCLGESWQGSFPLAGRGGQWNTVGHFPFYAGILANITSRREGKGTWVADGFRFTKVSEACSQRPHSALMTLRIVGVDLESSGLPDGQLTTHADLRIAFHDAVATSSAMRRENVRLIGLRRGSIVAEFELSGSKDRVLEAIKQVEADLANLASSKLSQTLCAAASAGRDAPARCHTELARTEYLEGTKVYKSTDEASVDQSEHSTSFLVVLIVAGCVIVAVSIAAIFLVRRSLRRKSIEQETSKVDGAVEVKSAKDNASECGSTATPPSEKKTSEVQTDVSGDISEIGSQGSRECTLDAQDGEYIVTV